MSNVVPLRGFGNGTALNFEVVGNTAEPAHPRENTIWVSTDQKITDYYFSRTRPENMADGDVWFITGTSSNAAFSAVKKIAVMVYPLDAKQMISGVLTAVSAKIYKDRAWVEWWNGELFRDGNQYEHITGGWIAVPGGGMDIVIGNDIAFTITGTNGRDGSAYTKDKIDLSECSAIDFDVDITSVTNEFIVGISASNNKSIASFTAQKKTETKGRQVLTVDVSAVTDAYYIAAYMDVGNGAIKGISIRR